MADDFRTPVERAKQVTFWVLVVAALVFWLLALVESRSIIGSTAATLAVVVLYTVVVAVARRNGMATVDRGVQWVLERGWRTPERTFALATADLRSAVRPSANGRARTSPCQHLDFAPTTLEALGRAMSVDTMTGLATDAFTKACQQRKAIFDDARAVRVTIGADRRLGVGRWARHYVPEGGLPYPPGPSDSSSRFGPRRSGAADDTPTRPGSDFEPTGLELDPDVTRHENDPDQTTSFPTLTLITEGQERCVPGNVPVTVGRESTCTVVLPSPDQKIHRHHATITYRPDGRWWLVPEGDHGVRVRGMHHGPGDAVVLADGDTIAWGRSAAALQSRVRIA